MKYIRKLTDGKITLSLMRHLKKKFNPFLNLGKMPEKLEMMLLQNSMQLLKETIIRML